MKYVLKVLSKYTWLIIAAIICLYIQANLDLKLPEFTSNIVNVGIQQKGIVDNTFNAIREKELNKILLFVNENDKDYILSNYDLILKGDKEYLDDYPILKSENVYVLKDINSKTRDKLSLMFSKPLTIKMFIEYGYESQDTDISIDEYYNYLETLPQSEIEKLVKDMNDKLDTVGESLTSQMTINQVINEYEVIGIDLSKIQSSYILSTGGLMILIAFGIMLIAILTSYLASKIAAGFARNLRRLVVNKVMTFSNREFEKYQTSSLITRSTNDIQQVQNLFVMLLRTLFYAPIIGIGAYIKVSGNSMSYIIAIAIILVFLLVGSIFYFAMPRFNLIQTLLDKLTMVTREILTGIPVIRAFSTENYEKKKFDKANRNITKNNLFIDRTMSIMMPSMMLIMNLVALLIIWVGGEKIDLGIIQVGDLIAFITYTMQIIMAFLMFSIVSIMLPRSIVSLRRIGEILNTKVSLVDGNKSIKGKDIKGVVEFKDVYFRYPDALEDVIQNVSFISKPGTTTAFIGSTGSGKSTLINLIPRFFDVTGGKILVDGINIKDIKLKDLRHMIGYVPQKGILFSGTIESNLMIGQDKKDLDLIKKATRIAQADEFINKKELGLKESISQGGTNVSGGQRQRLAIARALAKNPKILIFDDSFSALDYKTDALLRKTLKKEVKNVTVFIVAQRISTVLHADQIIVLDKGEVVGIGTHEELLKNNNIYKEIALSQLSKEELSNE